jgi:hypothetical protein
MPTVFRHQGYRFFFYSNEGDPLENAHIHVRQGEKIAKFWITPAITVAESYGMNSTELNKLCKVIAENKKLIQDHWNDFFSL